MHKKLLALIFLVFAFSIFAVPFSAQAGFGISPPYVKSRKPLFPGSHFEQTVTLLRSAKDDDLQARIVIEAPEMEDWITIQEGDLFDLPAGKTQVPMRVLVDVPDDAEIGDYKGYINVQIVPKGASGGGVSIALGARVDIELSVTNESFLDFLVRKIDIPDFEVFEKPWKWQPFAWFFYRIKVDMNIENTGNTAIAPSKVVLEVYDITEKEKLEILTDERIEKIEPFTTESVQASFPTKLGVGEYWGNIKVYKENEIVHKNKILFTISEPGQMENPPELGVWPYVMLGAIILLIVIIIVILIWIKIWKSIGKVLMILLWPVFYVYKKIKKFIAFLNRKFWQWMHRKSIKYQDNPQIEENRDEE